MKKLIPLFLLLGIAGVAFASMPPVRVTVLRDTTEATVLHAATPTPCDVVAKIREQDPALAAVPLSVGSVDIPYTEMRGTPGSLRPVTMHYPEVEIGLRILDTQTCTTSVRVIAQRGDQLIAPDGLRIAPVTQPNGIRWNDWATVYTITQPAHSEVIGVKFPLVKKQGKTQTVTMVFYVPRSDALPQKELIQAQQEYLTDLANRVSADIRQRKILSRSYPNTFIADIPAIAPRFAERIALDEHIDSGTFLLDPDGVVAQVAMTIGANLDQYSRYTCSPAKACGMMQFTPGTYALMVKTYPRAGLIPDFVTGASDPFNAIKATVLLGDYNLAQFRKHLTPAQFSEMMADPALTEELLASAFNTGELRTMTVYKAGLAQKIDDWAEATRSGKYGHLVAETKGYLAKLRYLRDQWPKQLSLLMGQVTRD